MLNHKILVTGGAGFIGSHTVIKLLEFGYSIVILDNFLNSKYEVIKRIRKISNKHFITIKGDIKDRKILKKIFTEHKIDSVIHFAGLKAVGESEKYPLIYYENNVAGSINLLQEMDAANVKNIIFSSSATVYGNHNYPLLDENTSLNPINNYGRTKLIVENILKGLSDTDSDWRIIILRYFNPIGAHLSGLIGDNPTQFQNNLLPLISQVAIGKKEKLLVFGNDYPTSDGTGKRDYIHVDDLANAHSIAINYFLKMSRNLSIFNIGTGKSHSVLEVIRAFEKASGVKIIYEIVGRRAGDVDECFADPKKAKEELCWEAKFDLNRMCVDAWRWQKLNPNGI